MLYKQGLTMKTEIDPKVIRRKVYMSYFEDGLWDVVLGLFLLGWGFTVWFDLPWLPGVTFIVFFWLALGLKQKVTYPRIGYARPSEQRKRQVRIVIAGAVILLGIIVILPLIRGGASQLLRDYFELLFSSMLAVAFGLIGYWFKIVRWYAFAALVFVFAVPNQWLGLSFHLSFIIPGGITLLVGLIIFIRFLRKYPIVSAEAFDGNE